MRHIFHCAVSVTLVTTSITRTGYCSRVSIPFRPMTPTRLQAKGWARVGRPGAHLLRRGAWYPVVRISSSQRVGRLFPLTYAVCPACRHRQGFESDVKELVCERCKKVGALAWDEMS